jgi:endonuclease/exonuclease/phosphatase (EEP) superfamily protein YafD
MLAAPGEPPTFKAMAFNVLYDSQDNAASVDVIAREHPDLVCLREMTPAFQRTFEAALSTEFPYRSMHARSGTWGVGLASRHPLSNTNHFEERPHKIPALSARVRFHGETLTVACLHLFPPVGKHKKTDGFVETMQKNANLRREQADWLVKRFQGLQEPLLVLGDMNEGPDGEALATMQRAGWVRACDAAQQARCSPTWPGPSLPWPAVFEIDHVLGKDLDFQEARTVRGGGSDHFPVVATFTLAPR